jgi:hypothetical protein
VEKNSESHVLMRTEHANSLKDVLRDLVKKNLPFWGARDAQKCPSGHTFSPQLSAAFSETRKTLWREHHECKRFEMATTASGMTSQSPAPSKRLVDVRVVRRPRLRRFWDFWHNSCSVCSVTVSKID